MSVITVQLHSEEFAVFCELIQQEAERVRPSADEPIGLVEKDMDDIYRDVVLNLYDEFVPLGFSSSYKKVI